MLAKLARGMVLVILAALIVVYVFSGDKPDAAPARPVHPDRVIGYMSA